MTKILLLYDNAFAKPLLFIVFQLLNNNGLAIFNLIYIFLCTEPRFFYIKLLQFIYGYFIVSLEEVFKRSHKKGKLFSAIILAMILPIGTAMSNHTHRKLEQVLYFSISKTKFYRFMSSKVFNCDSIWLKVFKLIPSPETNDRLIVALMIS